MAEVEARLQYLASIESPAKQALELADRCDETLIGIRLAECLQSVRERIKGIEQQRRL